MHKKKFRFKPNKQLQAIRLGSEVVDHKNLRGIVVEIVIPKNPTLADHGLLTVWQKDRVNYGGDNCEHYAYTQWPDFLKVVKY